MLLKNILKKRRMKKQRASAIDAGFTPEELAFYYGDTPFLYGQPYAGG